MNTDLKPILDATCGSRSIWFDKEDRRALYSDTRYEDYTLCDGRTLEIRPDDLIDFRCMPYHDDWFYMVIFDPPHLINVGDKSWLAAKYGKLEKTNWQDDLRKAGYLEHDDHIYIDNEGNERVSTRVLVTAKGLVKLAELIKQPLH